jgi:hypothetical protein
VVSKPPGRDGGEMSLLDDDKFGDATQRRQYRKTLGSCHARFCSLPPVKWD